MTSSWLFFLVWCGTPFVAALLAWYKNRSIPGWTFLPWIGGWIAGRFYAWTIFHGLPYEKYRYGAGEGVDMAVLVLSLLILLVLPRQESAKKGRRWTLMRTLAAFTVVLGLSITLPIYFHTYFDEEPRLLGTN